MVIQYLQNLIRKLTSLPSSEIIRRLYYRIFFRWGYFGKGVRIGKGVRFYGDTRKVYLYDHAEILDYSKIFIVGPKASVTLKNNASIGPFNIVNVHNPFFMGENSMTAPFVSFNDSDHAIIGRKSIRFSGYKEGVIEVSRDVWIGTGARILKNVKIGEGAVVGANAVVTKDVPSFTVVVGIPARIVRFRED